MIRPAIPRDYPAIRQIIRHAFGHLGMALIEAGNAECRARGLAAIIVLGHADYYPRMGFSAAAAAALNAPFSGPHFMALEFEPGVLQAGGHVRYASAFGV